MPSRTILISGASGLIGSALVPMLEGAGHRVLRLVRREARGANELRWTPAAHLFDERQLTGVDVIVNLAGETIARRWTSSRRRRIRDSRVAGTNTIVAAMAKTGRPITLINASAVGYYGDCGDAILEEGRGPGRGFLAEICRQWEGAAREAARQGSRVVMMRSGVVMSAKGGALPLMLMPFRLGVGGRLGSGRQWLSWIGHEDIVRAVVWLIAHPEITGPVNMTSPNPLTNSEFTRAVSRALHRPRLFPVPSVALNLILGEMADEMLLSSQRAIPTVLSKSGFEFKQPDFETALRSVVG